ncbi:hypothetical protein [Halopiger xanaduensis]|nr:hypothetical protein [Halopiger xanaduensis]
MDTSERSEVTLRGKSTTRSLSWRDSTRDLSVVSARFMLNAADVDRVGTLLELSVLLAVPEAEQPDDVSVSIEIDAAGD